MTKYFSISKDFGRAQRLSQEMQKNIANILQRYIKDPRLCQHMQITTISSVEISRDLRYVKVFVSFLINGEKEIKTGIKALKDASGFICYQLGKAMSLRIMPKLTFLYDNSLVEGMRISKLVTSIVKKK